MSAPDSSAPADAAAALPGIPDPTAEVAGRPRPAIPILNLYHLLTYAWDVLPQAQVVGRAITAAPPDLHHLLADVLRAGLTHLLKRGLAHDYVSHEELGALPRGKLLLDRSIRELTLPRRQVWLQTDERSPDSPLNQLLKATLHFLITHGALVPDLRAEIKRLLRTLAAVTLVPLTAPALRAVRVHRHTARYGLVVHVCHLIRRRGLPTEQNGRSLFADYRRDRRAMARLFEKFVRQFFAHHLRQQAHVWPKALVWDLQPAPDDALAARYLPQMRTDVVVEFPDRVLLIECKYYPEALVVNQYQQRKVRPAHLYQLYAYIQHLRRQLPHKPISAVLLYPVGHHAVHLRYLLEGEAVAVVTLDLHKPWLAIEAALLALSPPVTG